MIKFKSKLDSMQNEEKQLVKHESENNVEQKKVRRGKSDTDSRDFICKCGRAYLSYPALYTHVKTKHEGDLKAKATKSEKQSNNSKAPDLLQMSEKNFPSDQKSQQRPNVSVQQQKQFDIKSFRQFLETNFKDKLSISKQPTENLERGASLKISCKSQQYVRHVRQILSEMPPKEKFSTDLKKNPPEVECEWSQKSDELKAYNKHIGQLNEKLSHQKLTLHKYLEQNQTQNGKSVDYCFGHFLFQMKRELLETSYLTLLQCFIYELHECVIKRLTSNCQSRENATESMKAGELVGYLNESVNYFLGHSMSSCFRQPIVVCKLLFFFCRWMFDRQYTNMLINFNEVNRN